MSRAGLGARGGDVQWDHRDGVVADALQEDREPKDSGEVPPEGAAD